MSIEFNGLLTEAGLNLQQTSCVIDLGYFDSLDLFKTKLSTLVLQKSYLFHEHLNKLADGLANGDEYIEQQFAKSRANHRYITPSSPQEMAYDFAGDYVDVGRYMSGEPECMAMYDAAEKPVKFLTILLRCAHVGNAFDYYGMLLDIIDFMESNGTRCRIAAEINHTASATKKRVIAQIQIKDFHEPLNVGAFCAMFLSGRFNKLALNTCAVLGGSLYCYGLDHKYKNQGIPKQPETPDTIAFPSAWFNMYSRKSGNELQAATYLRELNLEHLISVA